LSNAPFIPKVVVIVRAGMRSIATGAYFSVGRMASREMPVDVAHVRRVEEFRATLHTPAEVIVDQQILTSGCFALGPDFDEGMREEVAQHFGITPDDVLVLGSGKLGFSISKKWQGGMVIRERYRPFTDNSDLDVAIIAPVLFDLIWEQAFVHMNDLGPWAEVRSFEKYFFAVGCGPTSYLRPFTVHNCGTCELFLAECREIVTIAIIGSTLASIEPSFFSGLIRR
jgi:hypothetical protein